MIQHALCRCLLLAASLTLVATPAVGAGSAAPPIFLPETPFWRYVLAPAAEAVGKPGERVRLYAALRRFEKADDAGQAARLRVELAYFLYRQGDFLAARATLLPARQYFTAQGDVPGLARCLSLEHLSALAIRHQTSALSMFSETPEGPEADLPPLAAEVAGTGGGPERSIPPRLAPWLALFDAFQIDAGGEESGPIAAETWRKLAGDTGAEPRVRGLAGLAAAYAASEAQGVEEGLAQARQAFRQARDPRGAAQADLVEATRKYRADDLAAARSSAAAARRFYAARRIWSGVLAVDLLRAAEETRAGQKRQALAAAASAERLAAAGLAVPVEGPIWRLSSGQIERVLQAARELPAIRDPGTGTVAGGSGRRARSFYRWARQTGNPFLELAASRALGESLMADGQWNQAVVYDLAATDLTERLAAQVPLRQRLLEGAHLDYQLLAATGLAGETGARESYAATVSLLAEWLEAALPILSEGELHLAPEELGEIRRELSRLRQQGASIDRHRLRALELLARGRRAEAARALDRSFAELPTFLAKLAEMSVQRSDGKEAEGPSPAELAYRHALEKAVILRDELPLRLAAERLAVDLAQSGDPAAGASWLPVMLGGTARRGTAEPRQPRGMAGPDEDWGGRVGRVVADLAGATNAAALGTRRWGRIATALAGSGLQEALMLKLLGGTAEESTKKEATIFRLLYASQLALSFGGTDDFVPLAGGASADELKAALAPGSEGLMWAWGTGNMGVLRWVQSLQGLPVRKILTDRAVRQGLESFLEFADGPELGWDSLAGDDEDDDEKAPLRRLGLNQWGLSYPALLLRFGGSRESSDSLVVLMRAAQADLDRAPVGSRLLGAGSQELLAARRDVAANLALHAMATGDYREAVRQLRRLVGPDAGRAGVDAYQYHYALALCYRRLGSPDLELKGLAAAVAASRDLRRVMPTRSLALRMENVRQLLMEEYLGALYRRGQAAEMATALWGYRQASVVPTAVVRQADPASAAELGTLKDLYGGLSDGPAEAPVTYASLRQQIGLFDLGEAPPKPGEPMLNSLDTVADVLVDEVQAGRRIAAGPRGAPVLGKDELLVAYFVGLRGLYLVTVDGHGTARQHYRRVDYAHLEELCDKVLAGLEEPGAANGPATAELYGLVLGFLPEMAGKRQLRLLLDGPLQLVPFQALRPSPAAPYLVERYTLSYASGTAGRGVRPAPAGEPGAVLVIADPKGNLDAADTEARDMARTFGARARPLVGPAATTAALHAELPRAGSVHFASHAIRNPHQPNFSYLELAGADRLYSLDLAGLAFEDKRVFLGACETLLAKPALGDDVYGIAEAFLGAGASSVVATLWSIDDAASAKFGAAFYDRIRHGASDAEALAEAERLLISGQAGAELAAPSYWAAFSHLAPLRFAAAAARPPDASRPADPEAAKAAVAMLQEAVERINALTSEVATVKRTLELALADKAKLQEELDGLQKDQEARSERQTKEEEKAQKAYDELQRALIEIARAAGATATVSGDVLAGKGGKPIPGAEVTLTDLDAADAATKERKVKADERGHYTFAALPVGHRYQLEVSLVQQNGAAVSLWHGGAAAIVLLVRDTKQDVELPRF